MKLFIRRWKVRKAQLNIINKLYELPIELDVLDSIVDIVSNEINNILKE